MFTLQSILPIKFNLSCKKEMYLLTKHGNKSNVIFRDWLYKDATIYLERKYNRFYNEIRL